MQHQECLYRRALFGALVGVLLFLVNQIHGDMIRVDCTLPSQRPGHRHAASLVFTQALTNTVDVVTLSTYTGTSFYIDC
ncbi:GPI-anchored surface protein, putative, partial [Bodo saltans]